MRNSTRIQQTATVPFGSVAVKTMIAIVLSLLFVSYGSYAQTFPSSNNCASKDLDLIETLLTGSTSNSLLPGNRKMQLTVANKTTSDRRSFSVWGTLKRYDINGNLTASQSVFFCVDSVKKNSTMTLKSKDSIFFGSNEELELSNIYTAWSSSKGTSEDCNYLATNTSKISPNCAVKSNFKIYTGVNSRFKNLRATCANGKGLLKSMPFGGKAPYTISVSLVGSTAQQTITTSDSAAFELPVGIYKVTVTDGKYNSSVFTQEVVAPTGIEKPQYAVTNPNCNLPKGQVKVTNGSNGYTYSLNSATLKYSSNDGNFTDVESDAYVLTSTLGICVSKDSVKVARRPNVPNKPKFTVDHPNCDRATGFVKLSSMENGVIYNMTQNGAVKYNSDANGIFSDVISGDYQVIAQGSECSNSDVTTINVQPSKPSQPDVTVQDPNCDIPKGWLKVNNAQNSTNYFLMQDSVVKYTAVNAEFTDVEAGDYMVVAVKGQCSNSNNAHINQRPRVPKKPGIDVTHPTCTYALGKVSLSNTETGITYELWQADGMKYTADGNYEFIDVVAGDYALVAIADVCKGTNRVMVNDQPPTPAAPVFTATQPTLCSATGTINVTSPLGNKLKYSKDGGKNWQDSPQFSGLAAGSATDLSFQVSNEFGCISSATSATGDCQPAAVSNTTTTTTNKTLAAEQAARYLGSASLTENTVNVKTIPNPFRNNVRFVITSPEAGNGVLDVFNIQGQKIRTVYQGYISAGANFFDLSLPENSRAEYIYVLKMGDRKVSGKLMQMGSGK